MKELVIISGKGGTGKTSIAASFAALAKKPVIADCDVDAADMHLLFSPQVRERHEFRSGHEAIIRAEKCTGCGLCMSHCRFDAVGTIITESKNIRYFIDPIACEGCGVCVRFCPENAIDFPDRLCGEWMISDTRCGPMVHAKLGTAAENSGKLVSIVRREARRIAIEEECSLVIIDGPPGIGCPVIASITGSSLVFIITEPTLSGMHDMERVLSLARHFNIKTAVCVNRWDINPEQTSLIEDKAKQEGAMIAGRIPWDKAFTSAQIDGLSIVEKQKSATVAIIQEIWIRLNEVLG